MHILASVTHSPLGKFEFFLNGNFSFCKIPQTGLAFVGRISCLVIPRRRNFIPESLSDGTGDLEAFNAMVRRNFMRHNNGRASFPFPAA